LPKNNINREAPVGPLPTGAELNQDKLRLIKLQHKKHPLRCFLLPKTTLTKEN